MDSLPDEIILSIIDRADQESLKSLAQTNRKFRLMVKEHYRHCLILSRNMGIFRDNISDKMLLEILHHLNNYNGWSLKGVLFDGHKYIKGNNSVSHDGGAWKLNDQYHRRYGPAQTILISFNRTTIKTVYWYIDGKFHLSQWRIMEA